MTLLTYTVVVVVVVAATLGAPTFLGGVPWLVCVALGVGALLWRSRP